MERSFLFNNCPSSNHYFIRAWLNDNAMFYETFICFYVSEGKPLCFSLCSEMFDDVERCRIYNIQNVCHALSLCYFFSINPIWHESSVMGGGGGEGHEGLYHNFVVIAPMIMKFGTGIKLDVFYTVVKSL